MEAAQFDVEEEAALIRKARWGNESAFEILYHRHARTVHALAFRITGDAAAAEDITQETFLRLLRFLGGLRSDRPLRPWLKHVATNAAIDRLRRDRSHLEDALPEEAGLSEAGDADAAIVGVDAERLLLMLPPVARAVVWLHAAEGWSHAQLAERFGHGESWSKSLVSRSIAQLRRANAPSADANHDHSNQTRKAATRKTR
ncbi:RNA polymerase sigma factor [Luteimonas aestuarii]|uniref:RNA polymerase sigma factor n=1 Tax=Luteimonas aestuarii TaxID=453837 RepID=A0A4R5U1G1_9GAMM|nr:RNA polymerase sigma factor [Luteimonas aestuarii]TDK27435.1 RNA polymerase sigma factor [Luteimonas aestuarii]